MSADQPAEYTKHTCLICGCHTNLIINIYEPRSGPNIVQLIQAKFKFQPLNEDKYLCFSCNNWLINWHSLQAMNSNDAESPSGTFRSSMNNLLQEKDAGAQRAAQRPVAKVRPQQLTEEVIPTPPKTNAQMSLKSGTTAVVADAKCSYSKQSFRLSHLRPRQLLRHKFLQHCSCGRAIIVRVRTILSAAALRRKTRTTRCGKCRKGKRQSCLGTQKYRNEKRCTKEAEEAAAAAQSLAVNHSSNQSLQRPLVDGKVVAMLRRLGTTLVREQVSANNTNSSNNNTTIRQLPLIMSPAKEKPRWTRPLEDDEILLDFDATISEVLPIVSAQAQAESVLTKSHNHRSSRKRLTYPITQMEDSLTEQEAQTVDEFGLQKLTNFNNSLPNGLIVSLM